MAERRAQLRAAGRADGAPPRRDREHTPGRTGRSSASSTRRTTGETTSCSATSSGATTRSACTSTSRSTGRIGRSRSWRRCATSSRSYSRCRRALRSSRASTPACTRRGRRSSRASFRAAACRMRFRPRAEVRELRSLPLRHGLDHRAHAALVERPAAPRLPDRGDPRSATGSPSLAEAQSLAAFAASLDGACCAGLRRGRHPSSRCPTG